MKILIVGSSNTCETRGRGFFPWGVVTEQDLFMRDKSRAQVGS